MNITIKSCNNIKEGKISVEKKQVKYKIWNKWNWKINYSFSN